MQISRLFEITYILLERGTVTARELAGRFEVSPRTIYRDIENLSASGIPVYMEKGRNGGIRLLPEFVLDKTVLTSGEKEEILAALQGLGAAGLGAGDSGAAGSNGAAGSALGKLAALFGQNAANWIQVNFTGWGWSRAGKENFERLKTAVLKKRAVSFTYHGSAAGSASGGETTRRIVEPLKLIFRGQAWYLHGWCRMRADYRFFKLSRTRDVVVLDEVFNREAPARIPDAEMPVMPAKPAPVAFRADEAVAFRIYDEYPHGDILQEPDGSLLVNTEMPVGDWLVSYFLTYGAHIEILEPVSLRLQMKETLSTALGNYLIE